MADRGQRKKPAAKPAVLTPYIVLRAIELSAAQLQGLGLENSAQTVVWMPVLNAKTEEGADGHIRVIKAAGKEKAIRAVTGEDGPDVVEGSWKAVSVTAWRGGETTVRTMKSDRLPLQEAIA